MKLELLQDPAGGAANKSKFAGEQIIHACDQAYLGVKVAEAYRKMSIAR
jgi:hypothetical protein